MEICLDQNTGWRSVHISSSFLKIVIDRVCVKEVWVDCILDESSIVLASEDKSKGLKYGAFAGFVVADDQVVYRIQLKINRLESFEAFYVESFDVHLIYYSTFTSRKS